MDLSMLQKERLNYKPVVPSCLHAIEALDFDEASPVTVDPQIAPRFPNLATAKEVKLVRRERVVSPLIVGVVLSGGQAAGGHNVITGLFDALKQFHPDCRVIGFSDGPQGIVSNKWIEITDQLLVSYRNQGGFDLIGSGRTKIETDAQFKQALATVQAHNLDGLVVIGGDDSNTNACFLAEYFLQHGQKTKVVGVPKTIDGDLKNEAIELSFGFDTACKIYSEAIGNIARDAISAKKYYYFIKLMGRSASHITLECALKCQPNLALIAEEAEMQRWNLQKVTDQIVELIQARAKIGKEYGVILIPEGIIEFLPDMKELIQALNKLIAADAPDVVSLLAPNLQETFNLLPHDIQKQLLFDRDPHGNVQVSKIETERLLIHLVSEALKHKKVKFSAQSIFCGYEGRSALPSNFDANYCYALGQLAAVTVARKVTGCIVSFQGLKMPAEEWQAVVSPLVSMLHVEERDGKAKAVIEKALVDVAGPIFQKFAAVRDAWRLDDAYSQTGPIQFFGPKALTDSVPVTIEFFQRTS